MIFRWLKKRTVISTYKRGLGPAFEENRAFVERMAHSDSEWEAFLSFLPLETQLRFMKPEKREAFHKGLPELKRILERVLRESQPANVPSKKEVK